MLEGAVYRPDGEIVPTNGLIDHFTATWLPPKTDTVNCCAPDGPRLIVEGVTDIVMVCRNRITVIAMTEESTILMAVIITFRADGGLLGAA